MSMQQGPSMRGAVDLAAYAKAQEAKQAAGAAGGAAGAGGGSVAGVVVEVTEQNFGDIVQQSMTVPVIIELAGDDPASVENAQLLRGLVEEAGGRILLGIVEAARHPQIVAAFQVQAVPTTLAVLGGQPAPLYQGAPPREDVISVLNQVLQVAQQNGITGTVAVAPADGAGGDEASADGAAGGAGAGAGGAGGAQAPEKPQRQLTPTQQAAEDALAEGRFGDAAAAFERAVTENPNDHESEVGLASARIWQRVTEGEPESGSPLAATLADADAIFTQGDAEGAMKELLDAFLGADEDGRNLIRERLVGYFEVVGVADPIVVRARGRLASMLF